METEIRTNVKTHTANSDFGYWDDEVEQFVNVDYSQIKQAADKLGVSNYLIDSLLANHEQLRDNVISDLVDMWKRLDTLEKRIKELENKG